MLSKIFKKEFNNTSYLQELLQDKPNKQWLKDGLNDEMVDFNYQDPKGNSFLMKCIKVNKTESASWLIQNNIDLTIQNKDGKTALFFAIEKKNRTIIKQILKSKKINLEQRDLYGRTILQNIVMLGHNEMAKVLIDNGANINNIDTKNRNLLYDALSYGDLGFIQYLLNLNTLDLNLLDENGNSIMHHAEVIKNDEIAEKLLIAGANATLKNKDGDSFLLTTALKGESAEKLIDIALDNGADVNTTSNNNTILMELIAISSKLAATEKARRDSLIRILKKMIKHGGDINAIEQNNETALFNAVRLYDYELISFLLKRGINPNIINDSGDTVLNIIIYEGIKALNIILLLIEYSANPNIPNKDGRTIYELLNMLCLHTHGNKKITDNQILDKLNIDGEYILIIKKFLSNNKEEQDLNYLDSTGDPLFFKPLLHGHFPLFKLYIANGLNINTISKAKYSIFYVYVLKVFEENKEDKQTCEKFQSNLSSLVTNKIDKHFQDALGWTVLHKIISTKCNETLFDILTKIILFDYTIQDLQGRTVIHNAVWSKKTSIVKKIYNISPQSINIVDNYEILPITYAALLGNQELVIALLHLNSNISGRKIISEKAIKKFSPMLKNLKKLKIDIDDSEVIRKIDILILQIVKDFKVV